MIHREASLLLSVLLAALPAAEVPGGTLDPVEHRLLLASVFFDGCADCERPSVPETITGTFLLTPEEPAPLDFDVYKVEDVELRTRADRPGGQIVFRGSGTYRVNTRLGEHVMRLELDATGHGAVVLDSGPVAQPEGPGDTIDITVREDGSRDADHVFSIRIVSAPAPVDAVPYELIAGSKVIVDCWVCEIVAPERPIVGTFLLDKVSSDPDPVARYRIWDFDFQSDDGAYKGVADGIYTQGGEVALVQTIELEARWDDDVLTTGLEGGPGPVAVTFPAIDIQAMRGDRDPPHGPIFIQGLRIIARPSEASTPYRRGDSNADAEINISDGVHILLWNFAGGDPPPCLDAADTNDDEKTDITDAVFLLNFLFLGGPPPPLPGPGACGSAPAPSRGCDSYPAC
jgi:hypothetical protein